MVCLERGKASKGTPTQAVCTLMVGRAQQASSCTCVFKHMAMCRCADSACRALQKVASISCMFRRQLLRQVEEGGAAAAAQEGNCGRVLQQDYLA